MTDGVVAGDERDGPDVCWVDRSGGHLVLRTALGIRDHHPAPGQFIQGAERFGEVLEHSSERRPGEQPRRHVVQGPDLVLAELRPRSLLQGRRQCRAHGGSHHEEDRQRDEVLGLRHGEPVSRRREVVVEPGEGQR